MPLWRRIDMRNKVSTLRYFAPLIQMAFCPITILFMWTLFTGPEVIPVVSEEVSN